MGGVAFLESSSNIVHRYFVNLDAQLLDDIKLYGQITSPLLDDKNSYEEIALPMANLSRSHLREVVSKAINNTTKPNNLVQL